MIEERLWKGELHWESCSQVRIDMHETTDNQSSFRLRAVSLFSWSVEQNARDTEMTKRVTEGARRERLPPSFPVSRGFAAQRSRARALPLLNLKKKRDCSQYSRPSIPTVYSSSTKIDAYNAFSNTHGMIWELG